MDLANLKATLDKFGRDNCYMIMFDNSHHCRIKERNEDGSFKKFDEIVTLHDDIESLSWQDEIVAFSQSDFKQPLIVTVVKHVENVQGLFFADEYTRKNIDYALEQGMK